MPQRPPQIKEQFDTLTNAVIELESLIPELREKLEPAIEPMPVCTKSAESGEPPDQTLAPLADGLRSLARRVRAMNNRISSITRSVEL